ncbi:hypothetical protein EV196_101609 [Mariniflexile fucanivorans]|uniref:Uncharacterized protein n=1 Tax=Mariniflexile fucanivorans TaxID=264023 RepID=A0A4R1RRU6_9FLAO|nr:hypothetical protein [Mariniflexile fucanivorans]TCL69175.1 hypothetical protein EV196_101609 [Mariniflexile fucanivorans]
MKYIIIYIYLAINVFLLILNWNLFSSSINMDLGFGVYSMPPLIMLQVIGLVALIIFAVLDGVKDLKREVVISELQKTILGLEKDAVINKLQNQNKLTETKESAPIIEANNKLSD